MTQKKGKFFNYGVTSTNDIKVFLTLKNSVGYFIGVKFV